MTLHRSMLETGGFEVSSPSQRVQLRRDPEAESFFLRIGKHQICVLDNELLPVWHQKVGAKTKAEIRRPKSVYSSDNGRVQFSQGTKPGNIDVDLQVYRVPLCCRLRALMLRVTHEAMQPPRLIWSIAKLLWTHPKEGFRSAVRAVSYTARGVRNYREWKPYFGWIMRAMQRSVHVRLQVPYEHWAGAESNVVMVTGKPELDAVWDLQIPKDFLEDMRLEVVVSNPNGSGQLAGYGTDVDSYGHGTVHSNTLSPLHYLLFALAATLATPVVLMFAMLLMIVLPLSLLLLGAHMMILIGSWCAFFGSLFSRRC